MTKKPDLTKALIGAGGKTAKLLPTIQPEATPEIPAPQQMPVQVAKTPVPPSRQGKKAITGHFDPAVSKQLKRIALNEDKTIQDLLTEALNDLFVKYGSNPLA